MYRLKKNSIGIRIVRGNSTMTFSEDMNQTQLELLHRDFNGEYTFITKEKVVQEINDIIDNVNIEPEVVQEVKKRRTRTKKQNKNITDDNNQ